MNIELRQVSVDLTALEASVAKTGMPRAEWWLELRRRPLHHSDSRRALVAGSLAARRGLAQRLVGQGS